MSPLVPAGSGNVKSLVGRRSSLLSDSVLQTGCPGFQPRTFALAIRSRSKSYSRSTAWHAPFALGHLAYSSSGMRRRCRPFGALVKLSGFDLLENNEAAGGLYCYAMAGRSYLDGHGAVAACID